MFNKDNLEEWIESLKDTIYKLKTLTKELNKDDDTYVIEHINLVCNMTSLTKLQFALEKMLASINNENM